MKTQAHHGGDKYNGVDIGVLMENSDEIMDKVETYLQEFVHPQKEATKEEIADICGLIKRVLRVLDIMFSILRRTHGQVTQDDMISYRNASEQAVQLWMKLDLNYTPSFHYVHIEAHRLLKIHGGFGELTEDHLEQSHQTMDKIHQRLGRLGFGAKRAVAISRLAKMATDPNLNETIESVKINRKRKSNKIGKGAAKTAEQKEVKKERRTKNLAEEMRTEKDSTIVSGPELARKEIHSDN